MERDLCSAMSGSFSLGTCVLVVLAMVNSPATGLPASPVWPRLDYGFRLLRDEKAYSQGCRLLGDPKEEVAMVSGTILRILLLSTAVAVPILAQQRAVKSDPFAPLRFFVGAWRGGAER